MEAILQYFTQNPEVMAVLGAAVLDIIGGAIKDDRFPYKGVFRRALGLIRWFVNGLNKRLDK